MPVKKRALGRGLDSLIGSVPAVATQPEPGSRQVVEIRVDQLRPNLNQPRSLFNEEHLSELANSIREKGVLQPLLVRKRHDHYEIVAGERRHRASLMAGLDNVPCIVTDVTDEASFEIALIENLQREDLNAVEESRAFQSLIQQFSLSQEEAAARVGKSRSTVANSLRLLNLPLDIQEDILEDRISAGHARAILSVQEPPKQRNLRNMIVSKGLSVREAEAAARRMTRERKPQPPKPASVEAQMRSLQEQFSMKIGLPVFIRPVSHDSGKVEIQYRSLDDFEILTDFFGIDHT
ncbi:ParB/RepB/Spo0J family partition protein [bacterium]|nr:ParB/RepB/Spo0J family partition protein [bacterium]